jgi:hypothetical protein
MLAPGAAARVRCGVPRTGAARPRAMQSASRSPQWRRRPFPSSNDHPHSHGKPHNLRTAYRPFALTLALGARAHRTPLVVETVNGPAAAGSSVVHTSPSPGSRRLHWGRRGLENAATSRAPARSAGVFVGSIRKPRAGRGRSRAGARAKHKQQTRGRGAHIRPRVERGTALSPDAADFSPRPGWARARRSPGVCKSEQCPI